MGRWGSCIAWYCSAVKQHKVKLYGKPGSPDFIRFKTERKNDYLVLPEAIELTDDLEYAVTSSDYIIVSIPALPRIPNRIKRKQGDLPARRFV